MQKGFGLKFSFTSPTVYFSFYLFIHFTVFFCDSKEENNSSSCFRLLCYDSVLMSQRQCNSLWHCGALCYCTFVSLLLLNCLTLNLTPSPAVMKPGLLVGCHVMSVGLIDVVWLCNLIKLSCGSKSVTFKYSSVFPWFKVSESLTVCSFLVWPTVEICPTSAFDGLRNNHFIALFMSTMIGLCVRGGNSDISMTLFVGIQTDSACSVLIIIQIFTSKKSMSTHVLFFVFYRFEVTALMFRKELNFCNSHTLTIQLQHFKTTVGWIVLK